ncbi:ABC transporter permease subunit [candidate division KSB3 bacterium]|nr:ABC transporter permease subunit [candidate division KSB3 bacterium]
MSRTSFRRLARSTSRKAVIVIFATVVLVYILMPFYWMLKSSLQTNLEIAAIPPVWIPKSPTLEFYREALHVIPFFRYTINSLFVSGTTTIACTCLASMAGYVLARYKFPGATLILGVFLFAQLVPGITRIFPLYFLLRGLNLLNTYTGLIVTYIGFSLPYETLMLQGYFRGSYPKELEEAAMIDGCNLFMAFLRIVLPVSLPGIAAIAIHAFLAAWNDFLWASIFLSKGHLKTLQIGVHDFIGEAGVQGANSFMAACLMATIPALILFSLLQRSMVHGLSAGAVKG